MEQWQDQWLSLGEKTALWVQVQSLVWITVRSISHGCMSGSGNPRGVHSRKCHLVLWWNTLGSTALQTGGKNFEKNNWVILVQYGPLSHAVSQTRSQLLFKASLTDWCLAPTWSLSLLSCLMMACLAFLSRALASSVLLRMEAVHGICTKLWIKKNALLNNTKAVDVLGGKGVESSRGQGVMFWG